MKIRLDPVIAEIAKTIDANILDYDRNFAELPQFNRLHFIFRALAKLDIATAEKSRGRKVFRWRLSRRLAKCVDPYPRGIPGESERIEALTAISTLADEF